MVRWGCPEGSLGLACPARGNTGNKDKQTLSGSSVCWQLRRDVALLWARELALQGTGCRFLPDLNIREKILSWQRQRSQNRSAASKILMNWDCL